MDDDLARQMVQLLTEIRDLLTVKPPATVKAASDDAWLQALVQDPVYQGIDVMREWGKCANWCRENHVKQTRKRFINWLNRAERAVTVPVPVQKPNVPLAYTRMVAPRPPGVPPPPDVVEKLSKVMGKDIFKMDK